MELACPECNKALVRSGKLKRHCEACNIDFNIQVACNKCGSQLERLAACGAVSFWCNQCNELKSKSSSIYSLQES